jgi:hypothetical protein
VKRKLPPGPHPTAPCELSSNFLTSSLQVTRPYPIRYPSVLQLPHSALCALLTSLSFRLIRALLPVVAACVCASYSAIARTRSRCGRARKPGDVRCNTKDADVVSRFMQCDLPRIYPCPSTTHGKYPIFARTRWGGGCVVRYRRQIMWVAICGCEVLAGPGSRGICAAVYSGCWTGRGEMLVRLFALLFLFSSWTKQQD